MPKTPRKSSDISARKDSPSSQSQAFLHSFHGVAVLSPPDNVVVECNPAFARLVGLPEMEVVGRSLLDFATTTSRPALQGRLEACDQEGTAVAEAELTLPDGSSVPAEIGLTSVRDVDGHVASRVASVVNITKRRRAINELNEASYFNEQVVQNAQEGIIVYDRELKYRVWNAYMERLTGLRAGQVIGRCTPDLFPFLKDSGVTKLLAGVLESGEPATKTFPYIQPGTKVERWVTHSSRPLRNASGQISGVIAVVRDVTVLRTTEEARQASEARYRLIAENTGDAIWLLDLKTELFTYSSPAVQRLRGYTPEEVMRQRMSEVFSAEDYRQIKEQLPLRIAAFLDGDESARTHTDQLNLRHRDGRMIPTEVVTTLLADQPGQVTQILGVSRDISGRLKAEEESRASRERFVKMFAASPAAILVTRFPSGEIVDANAAFERMTGFTREEVIGQTTSGLKLWADPEGRTHLYEKLGKGERIVDSEVLFRPRSGKLGFLRLSVERFHDNGQDYLIGMMSDITDRRRLELLNRFTQELALGLSRTTDLDQGLALCLEAAMEASGMEAGGIYLTDPATGNLCLKVHRCLSDRFTTAVARIATDSPNGRLIAAGTPIYARTEEIGPSKRPLHEEEGLVCFGSVPLLAKGQLVGCLNVASRVRATIEPADRSSLEAVAAATTEAIQRLQAESRLRDESLLLANIIESTHAGTWEWNVQTGETVFNETWADMLGYRLEELQPTSLATWERLAHPDDVKRTEELLQRHFRGENPYYENECRMRHKDGRWLWVLDRGRLVSRTAEGAPLLMIGAHTEVTSIKQSELAQRESEQRLRITLESAELGIFEWLFATGGISWTELCERIWAYAPGEFDGQIDSLRHRVLAEDYPVLRERLRRSRAEGSRLDHEFRIRWPDGSVHWVALHGRVDTDEQGQPQRLRGIVQDVSVRKANEETVLRKELEFRAMFEVASVGMGQADPETGRLVRVNQRLCKITGYSEDELRGMLVREITHPEDRGADWEQFQKVIRGELPSYHIEKRYVRKDGTVVWVGVNMTVVRDPEGRPVRTVAMIEDINKRKRDAMVQDARNRLLEYASTHTVEELLIATLDEAERLTDSRVGFYHFLGADQNTLTLQAWSTRTTREMCKAEGKGRHYNIDMAGVWVDCIRERRPVIHNDYPNLAHRKGLPEGHATVLRELVVPVFRSNAIVSILGIGNKQVPYTEEDVETVSRLADLAWDVVELRRTEMALFESERRLRLFVQQAPVALAMLDQDMRYVEYSRRWTEDYGLGERDLRGLSHYEVFPEIGDGWKAIHRRVLGGETIRADEDRFVRADGTTQWLRWEVRPWRSNQANGIMIFSENISARKEAEDAVRAHEVRYRNLVESSADWIWEVDAQGRYTYASERVREMLGYEPAEVLGRTPYDFMPEAEAVRVRELVSRLWSRAEPIVAMENTNLHKDGRPVVIETSGAPIHSPEGGLLGYRGIDRDITARRAVEQKLRLHGAALEAAANAVVITDTRGKIEWVNPAFTAATGWTLEEAMGQNSRELENSGLHEPAFFERISQTIADGRVWRGEIVNRRKDGNFRTEEMTITPLQNEQGRISHYIEIKQDITERKQHEANNRQVQRLESIGTLAGGIAHDLNNILTPITIGCSMALDTTADPGTREILTMMREGAQRGADIIRQLLTFSRGMEGKRVPVDPRHVLREVGAIMRETFPKDIELSIDVPPGLPTVMADPTQIHQLVLNLCVNARDAMPAGGRLLVRVRSVRIEEHDPMAGRVKQPGPHIRIDVVDTGHGIPADIQERIFDPFFTTKAVGKGTGLGLSTVLGIVRSHDGAVFVESEPDHGATFSVYLPAAQEETTPAPQAGGSRPPPGQGKLILVVDDERNIRDAARMLLQHQGYRVLLANHGREALALHEKHRSQIHLVITDIMMPVMNGVTMVKELRQAGATMPILATTGLGDSSHQTELAQLGVRDFLLKPYTPDQLLNAISAKLTETRHPG